MKPTAINWVRHDTGLSWAQADQLAKQAGGMLLTDLTSPTQGWLSALADDSPSNSANESLIWVGAHRFAGQWVWADGAPVDLAKFAPEDLLLDQQSANAGQSAALANGYLTSDLYEAPSSFLMEYATSRITGTSVDDWFMRGGAGPGQTLRLLGGDDFYNSDGGGVIFAGDGDDQIQVLSRAPTTVYDGAGVDLVLIGAGVIKAALDAQDDVFYASSGRVSYADATSALTVTASLASGAQIGRDTIDVEEVVGGAGDDTMAGIDRLRGGGGSDWLSPLIYAEGGAGADTLIANSSQRVELRGEVGDDTLIFYTGATVSGGAGADRFVFEAVTGVTINDLGAGDQIDLSALLTGTVEQAFAEGYLRTSVSKGYTQLAIDIDGAGDEFVELAVFKGIVANLDDFLFI